MKRVGSPRSKAKYDKKSMARGGKDDEIKDGALGSKGIEDKPETR